MKEEEEDFLQETRFAYNPTSLPIALPFVTISAVGVYIYKRCKYQIFAVLSFSVIKQMSKIIHFSLSVKDVFTGFRSSQT
jgi:hypothetical protein